MYIEICSNHDPGAIAIDGGTFRVKI